MQPVSFPHWFQLTVGVNGAVLRKVKTRSWRVMVGEKAGDFGGSKYLRRQYVDKVSALQVYLLCSPGDCRHFIAVISILRLQDCAHLPASKCQAS